MILLEKYEYGNSNILNAEKCLDKFMKDIRKKYSNKNIMGDKKFIEHPELLKMNKFLTKEFIADVNVYVNPISPLGFSGPHTVPGTIKFFKRDVKDPKRLDPKDTVIHVFIDTQSFISMELTSKEMMGIILHEIGHNLDGNIMMLGGIVANAVNTLGMSAIASSLIHYGYGSGNRLIGNLPNFVQYAMTVYGIVSREISRIVPVIGRINIFNILSYFSLGTMMGYYGERFGDSVATRYGYGSHLISALEKLGGVDSLNNRDVSIAKKLINTNPITGLIYDINDAIITCAMIFITPHPANINRAKNTLARLKEERKHGHIPKNMLKDLDKEIENIETIINNIEKIEPSKGKIISSLTNKALGAGNGRSRNILDLIYNPKEYEY